MDQLPPQAVLTTEGGGMGDTGGKTQSELLALGEGQVSEASPVGLRVRSPPAGAALTSDAFCPLPSAA